MNKTRRKHPQKKRESEIVRDSFGILYTGYLLSIVKIKRDREREKERDRNNKKCDKKGGQKSVT